MNNTNNIKLLIVDDHQMFIDGLKAILRHFTNITVIGEALSGEDALVFLDSSEPDVIITDISMPGMKGDELAKKVSELYPNIRILALSMHNDIAIIDKMIKAGVKGYILKNTGRKELIEAVNAVSRGETFYSTEVKEEMLKKYVSKTQNFMPSKHFSKYKIVNFTRREKQLIKFLIEGLSNADIAENLRLSVNTVKSHRKNIYSKTNVNNTASLIEYLSENKIEL